MYSNPHSPHLNSTPPRLNLTPQKPNSSNLHSKAHKTQVNVVGASQSQQDKPISDLLSMPLFLQKDCQYDSSDQNIIICKTKATYDYAYFAKTLQITEKIKMKQKIEASNNFYQSTIAILRPRFCDGDPQNDKFLVCKQKMPLEESKEFTQKIVRIQKIDYFRRITINTLLLPKLVQNLLLEINHRLQYLTPSKSINEYVTRLSRFKVLGYIPLSLKPQSINLSDVCRDKHLSDNPDASIQRDQFPQSPFKLVFVLPKTTPNNFGIKFNFGIPKLY